MSYTVFVNCLIKSQENISLNIHLVFEYHVRLLVYDTFINFFLSILKINTVYKKNIMKEEKFLKIIRIKKSTYFIYNNSNLNFIEKNK